MIIHRKSKLACLISCVFILNISLVWAQVQLFEYKADVHTPDSSGVYKIELDPDLIAKSTDQLNDIRLFDNTGKNIAYILSSKLSVEEQNNFVDFPIINSNISTNNSTTYVSENKYRKSINHLWIRLKNTDVYRTVNLSGSDDLKKWFAIKENIQLAHAGNGNKPDYEQSLSFPISNYRYFKIEINGRNKTPVKILETGVYIINSKKPQYTLLPPVRLSHKDTIKKSSIFIHLSEPYEVDKLHLNISGTKYYNRKVVVYGFKQNYDLVTIDRLCDTVLSSVGSQDIIFSAKTKQIQIDIFNGDDNPLTVSSVKAYQLKKYVISYLDGGNHYYLLTGYPLAKEANYDLSFLKYSSFSQLPILHQSAVYKNTLYKTTLSAHDCNYTIWLWGAIVLVLLLLGFLTWKMVRELNASTKA